MYFLIFISIRFLLYRALRLCWITEKGHVITYFFNGIGTLTYQITIAYGSMYGRIQTDKVHIANSNATACNDMCRKEIIIAKYGVVTNQYTRIDRIEVSDCSTMVNDAVC